MSLFSRISGIVGSLFQIGGPAGPILSNSSGSISVRNSGDTSYINVRGADPSTLDDLVTKRYGDANYTGGGGGSGATGTSTINFGSFPGGSDTTLLITGQTSITSTSVPQAWIFPQATVDHSADEHRVEEIEVRADTVVAGTGFTIYARGVNDRIYGHWSVAWAWR